jgi:hypothetical protein
MRVGVGRQGVGEALGGGHGIRQLGWGGLVEQSSLFKDRDGRELGGEDLSWPRVNQPGDVGVLLL